MIVHLPEHVVTDEQKYNRHINSQDFHLHACNFLHPNYLQTDSILHDRPFTTYDAQCVVVESQIHSLLYFRFQRQLYHPNPSRILDYLTLIVCLGF